MAAGRISVSRRLAPVDSTRSVSRRQRVTSSSPAQARQATIFIVRWGLVAACLLLVSTGDGASTNWVSGIAIVAALGTSNLALIRVRPETLEGAVMSVGIAIFDSLLVIAAWYVSGYQSFAPVIFSLCLVNLALVGVSLPEIAAVALAAFVVYFAIGNVD